MIIVDAQVIRNCNKLIDFSLQTFVTTSLQANLELTWSNLDFKAKLSLIVHVYNYM